MRINAFNHSLTHSLTPLACSLPLNTFLFSSFSSYFDKTAVDGPKLRPFDTDSWQTGSRGRRGVIGVVDVDIVSANVSAR